MSRTTNRIRKAGVATLVALTAVTGFGFAPSAGAAPADNTDLKLTASSTPTIGVGKANQAVGNETLTVTPGDTLTAGDQIVFTVEDSDGTSCAAGDTLAFSSLPTISVAGTATVVTTLESRGGNAACGTNQLRINVTGSGTATITGTNIAYTVGTGVSVGEIGGSATLNGNPINIDDAANAFITTALATANSPATGAAWQSGGSYAISPIVISEQVASAANNSLCVVFDDDIESTPAPAPTVAVSGGTDTATLTVDTAPTNADTVKVNVTSSTPASTSTFTISGIRLETDDTGVQSFTLFDGTCTGAPLSSLTNAGAVTDVDRTAGADRFATAQKLFEDNFGCEDWAIIARADQYPDALAASYLAGQEGTGILLTNTDSIPASTLNTLRNEGVNNVYLLGGTSAISDAVATQLDNTTAYDCGGDPESPAATLTVERIGGQDRFQTAQLVAEYPGLNSSGFADINNDGDDSDAAKTAIVASGLNFPDALAAGALASEGDNTVCCGPLPLLLSGTTSVPSSTMGALANLGIVNVIVVGGTDAVSNAAVAQLTTAGYNVRRIAGATRQATAAALATVMFKEFGYDSSQFFLARGDNFADALTGGPVAGYEWNDVILLTGSPTSLSADTTSFLRSWNTNFGQDFTYFQVLGGTAAVSQGVIQEVLNAASQQ